MTQSCSQCGKEFRNGNLAVAVITGAIDYKNYQGFKDDENGYVALLCKKCSKNKKWIE
jgi:hypothetical protein